MATAQKKTASAKTAKSAGTKKKTSRSSGSRSKTPPARPIRREVGGGICLLLSLCTLISYFQSDGALLRILPDFLKGTIGWGAYLMAPALLAAGVTLLLHRGRPVALPTACALLLPVQAGGLHHLMTCKLTFEGEGLLKLLWTSGQALESGGVLSGTLARATMSILGKAVTLILFLAVFLLLAAGAFYRIAMFCYRRWEERERYEEYVEEEEEERPVRQSAPARAKRQAPPPARRPIDIPLDGAPAAKRPGLLNGFFRQRSTDQRTPDQVLTGQKETVPVEDMDLQSPFVEEPGCRERETPREGIPSPRVTRTPAPPPETAKDDALRDRRSVHNEGAAGKSAAPIFAIPPDEEGPEPIEDIASRPTERSTDRMPDKQQDKQQGRAVQEVQAAQTDQEAQEELSAQIESQLNQVEGEYRYPSVSLLRANREGDPMEAGAELRSTAKRLADTLTSFGVAAQPGDVIRGPAVTRYEFILDQGVKLKKLTSLSDDIALALGASGVRIAPVAGKLSVVGIEVPNRTVTPVLLRDVLEGAAFQSHRSSTAFAVGRDIANSDIVGDIGELPHVLIAGTTGSGKSVCTNSLIISLLYKSSPEDVRFIMVDPKMVELAPYNGIPHLLIPVVTDSKKAAGALQWAVYEMEKRYRKFSELGVKKLSEYNALAERQEDLSHMASVVVVIDELADLMMVAAKEVEESICRVAQKGRAAGIHLVVATQRPSADVITGLMKANIPSRIAFAVAASVDSRIILDNVGAEKLVGRGDMLYAPLGKGMQRVQGCFVTPEEIEQVVAFVKERSEPQYSDEVMQKINEALAAQEKGGKGAAAAPPPSEDDGEADELLDAAVEIVLETGMASTSMLQRRLKLGYSRAGRLMDQMEERGIVGPFEGSKPRQVLITRERWQESQMAGGLPSPIQGEPIDPNDPPWLE